MFLQKAPPSPVTASNSTPSWRLHEYLGYDGQLFGTQHVVEYEEEARLGGVRSHAALTYDHSRASGTWTPTALPPGHVPRLCLCVV